MNAFHEDLKPLVERAAVKSASKWPSYVGTEDIAQEIWAWIYSRQNSIRTAMRNGDWEAKVYSTMLKAASEAASAEDRATSGYSKDDTYVYSAAVVETLLDSAFTYEDWQSFGTFGDGQPTAKGQVNETGDVIAMLSDVKAALAEIKAEYREVLFLRHGVHLSNEAAGVHLGMTRDGVLKRHKRAINAMRDVLGRVDLSDLQSGWEDRRQSFGNAQANAMTDRMYEG